MEYKNSNGYFKDPVTFEDLSPDTPRVVQCSIDASGKFIWPQVAVSNGDIVKIVYKLFTDEEKDLYKQYRGRGTGESKPRAPRQVKKEMQLDPQTGELIEVAVEKPKPVKQVKPKQEPMIGYDVEAVASEQTLAVIANCDKLIGINQMAGITYALLCAGDSHKIYHVPRALINDAEMTRLCAGV